jgi:hypothetical protein
MKLNNSSLLLLRNEAEEEAEAVTVVEHEVLGEEGEVVVNSVISLIKGQLQQKQKTMLKMQLLDKKNRLYKQL